METAGELVRLPGSLQSVTRSHADGSVAIVLVNITDGPRQVTVPVRPEDYDLAAAALYRMSETGERTRVPAGPPGREYALELAPREVAFLILARE